MNELAQFALEMAESGTRIIRRPHGFEVRIMYGKRTNDCVILGLRRTLAEAITLAKHGGAL